MHTNSVQRRSVPCLVAVVIFSIVVTAHQAAGQSTFFVYGNVLNQTFVPNVLNLSKNDLVEVHTYGPPFQIFQAYSLGACVQMGLTGFQYLVNKTNPAFINVSKTLGPSNTIYFYGENQTWCDKGFRMSIISADNDDGLTIFKLSSGLTGVILASLAACIGGSLIVTAFLVIMHRITNRRLMTVFHRYRVDVEASDGPNGGPWLPGGKTAVPRLSERKKEKAPVMQSSSNSSSKNALTLGNSSKEATGT